MEITYAGEYAVALIEHFYSFLPVNATATVLYDGKPALLVVIRKFNKYCDVLADHADHADPVDSSLPIPLPRHLSSELNILRDDPYLMEDVWVQPINGEAPLWLTDVNVRKGIRAMLKEDRCLEERRRLGTEADNLVRWLGNELAAVELAMRTTSSMSFFF